MTLVKYNNRPTSALSNFFDDEVVRDFFNTGFNPYNVNRKLQATGPKHVVNKTDNGFVLDFAVPGARKEDLNLAVDKGTLTVTHKYSEEHKEGEGRINSFRQAEFTKSFTLDESIDAEAISASYENGVLSINLPKRPEPQPEPAKRIEIR